METKKISINEIENMVKQTIKEYFGGDAEAREMLMRKERERDIVKINELIGELTRVRDIMNGDQKGPLKQDYLDDILRLHSKIKEYNTF